MFTYQGSLFGATEDGDVTGEEIALHLVIRRVLARGARCQHHVHGRLELHQRRLLTRRQDVVVITPQNLPRIVQRDQLHTSTSQHQCTRRELMIICIQSGCIIPIPGGTLC